MRRTLSKSEVKELNEQLKISFDVELLDKKDVVEIIDEKFVSVNQEIWFFYHVGKLVPTLKLLMKENFLKKIVVDMGAVKFMISGADVMRPGIKEIDDRIKKDDFVSVIDINNKKPLAVGIALFDADELQTMKTGRVIKNIHYVGDEIWRIT